MITRLWRGWTKLYSIDAIRAFAGDDHETPVLEPRALALLLRYDQRALHFTTATFSPDTA